jgi:DNA-binding MarR family transcriptional regulator
MKEVKGGFSVYIFLTEHRGNVESVNRLCVPDEDSGEKKEKILDECSSANDMCRRWGCMVPSHLIWRIGAVKDLADRFVGLKFSMMGYEGFVPSHGGILALLLSSGGKLQMKEIVDRVGRTKSTVSELVNKLEKFGLVKRCECNVDGRVCYVSLTEKGLAFEKELLSVSEQLNAVLYDGFSTEETDALEALVERMKVNLLKL